MRPLRSLDQPVRWVHVSDLADLSGLLTGRRAGAHHRAGAGRPAARDDYLPRLAAGRGRRRGRRTRPARRRDPDSVLAAGAELGLPVVALHRPVRFVEVTEEVHRRIVADQYAEVAYARRVHEAFTELSMRRASIDADRRGRRRDARDAGRPGGPQPAGAGLRRAGHPDGRAAGGLGASVAAGGGGLVDGAPGGPVPRGVGPADRPGGRRRRLPDRDDAGACGPGAGAAPDGRAEPHVAGASGAERTGRRSAPRAASPTRPRRPRGRTRSGCGPR